MDWDLAIEKHREALARILAMLVAMAGLASPLAGFEARSSGRASGSTVGQEGRGDCEAIGVPGNVRETRGEAEPALTLPRHLHRLILRLLRPAESAARRLIIVMARGLVVAPVPPRRRKPATRPTFLRRPGGTGILLPPGVRLPANSTRTRSVALPLLDPPKPFHPRGAAAPGVPRISFPGSLAPSPIAPARPPMPDDPLDASRLALRLKALSAALDDLPRQAARFARWQARGADAAGAQAAKRRTRRAWPLRPGRAPGQRPPRQRGHEVYEVLHDLHALAFDVLDNPDTS